MVEESTATDAPPAATAHKCVDGVPRSRSRSPRPSTEGVSAVTSEEAVTVGETVVSSSTCAPPAETVGDDRTSSRSPRRKPRSRSGSSSGGEGSPRRRRGPSADEAAVSAKAAEVGRATASNASPTGAVLGRKTDPARVVAKLRTVAGGDEGRLALLTGLVCARLANPESFSRDEMQSELAPLVTDDSGQLEDLLEWLERERRGEVDLAEPPPFQLPPACVKADESSNRSTAQWHDFDTGNLVRLQGLKSAPQLNGSLGICEDWEPGSGRWKVRLKDTGEIKAVKPENLTSVEETRAAPATSSAAKLDTGTNASSTAAPNTVESAREHKNGQRQFKAALEKLRAKAEAEENGSARLGASSHRYGVGDPRGEAQRRTKAATGGSHPADFWQISKDPIAFVAAEDAAGSPLRKVTVVDPRGNGRRENGDSSPEPEIGRIAPPVGVQSRPQRRQPQQSWTPTTPQVAHPPQSYVPPAYMPHPLEQSQQAWQTAYAPPAYVPPGYSPHQGMVAGAPPPPPPPTAWAGPPLSTVAPQHVGIAQQTGIVPGAPPQQTSPSIPQQAVAQQAPTVFEGPYVPDAPREPQSVSSPPLAPAKVGNLNLTVSVEAREEDKARLEAKDKRKALEESRMKMLEKLTKQLQHCIARVQSGVLDESSREKYEDMIMTLKSQMAKISSIS